MDKEDEKEKRRYMYTQQPYSLVADGGQGQSSTLAGAARLERVKLKNRSDRQTDEPTK